MNQRFIEVEQKLQLIRETLKETEAAGVVLKGTDWFAWVTAGASNTVLLTAETGIASVLITQTSAWVLTDEIESQRLLDEELTTNFELFVNPWADALGRENFVLEVTEGKKILSDRQTAPQERARPNFPPETPLPPSLLNHKRKLLPTEIDRYRQIGALASKAMTEVLQAAKPTWSEYQLAGAGAEALWGKGLHPALTLVAGERRLPLYRHATATAEPLGKEAMLVFCARGYGLYANLTRFVVFGNLTKEKQQLHAQIRDIEAQALNSSAAGVSLDKIYQTLDRAYAQQGYPEAIKQHHQGGTTGYLSREIVANPLTQDTLTENMAMAWNPSLPGTKIEDTFIILNDGKLENLTFDPEFPYVETDGRNRPIPLTI